MAIMDDDIDILKYRLELEKKMHSYWHKAFCVSMFFHGMISFPIIVGVIIGVISGIIS